MTELEQLRADRAELASCLTELLRLYDWRNELGNERAKLGGRAGPDYQRKELLQYGREKAAAWVRTRALLVRLSQPPQQAERRDPNTEYCKKCRGWRRPCAASREDCPAQPHCSTCALVFGAEPPQQATGKE